MALNSILYYLLIFLLVLSFCNVSKTEFTHVVYNIDAPPATKHQDVEILNIKRMNSITALILKLARSLNKKPSSSGTTSDSSNDWFVVREEVAETERIVDEQE